MHMNRTVPTLLVAALVLLAGCAGGITGQSGTQSQMADSGTVQFYVSDEKNAIDQFEHLNVTITKVGFAQSSSADANASASEDVNTTTSDDVETDGEDGLQISADGNVTAGENATFVVTYDGEPVENATVTVDDADVSVTTDANGTVAVQVPADVEEFEVTASTDDDSDYGETEAELEFEFDEDGVSDADAENDADDGGDSDDESEGDTEWIEHEVDSKTVDLTELQGDNATLLQNMSVPAGEYEKVFVHVEDVNGTLKSGEDVNVKLPSQKLHLNKDFTVDSESNVEFVFDITVFEAGNSGKYILKPVASESGTDVPIERVDDDGDANIEANFVGDVTAGENATVKVTQDGEPVENATIEVDDLDVTVTTDANGTATVQVPEDAEEFEVEASTEEGSDYGEGEAELELEFGDDGQSDTDEEDESKTAGDDSDDSETEADGEADLAASLDDSLTAGENATITVTDGDGNAVENATVAVDGEVVGETNADGELTFTVPEDVSMDSDVTVTSDGESVTIEAGTVAAAS